MRRVIVASACSFSRCPQPTRAQPIPPVQFTTIQHGEPNPVASGGQISWFLQGLNEGSETLADIPWSNPVCGTQTYPGPWTTGMFTPEATCTTTAPQSGEAILEVQWSARIVSTGDVLTPLVHTVVAVQAPTTTTETTRNSGPARDRPGAMSDPRVL